MTKVTSLLTLAASAFLATAFFATPANAQQCPGPGDQFYKNDAFPDVPAGALPIGLVTGLCPGEGAAAVFDIVGGPQTLSLVGIPYGSPLPGSDAVVNIQVFDNVTFAGGVPDMSNKVFDLAVDAGINVQVPVGGISTFDMTPYSVEVSGPRFAVAVIMEFNPNGSCTGGYTANFFTDATVCQSEKSLIFIQGQGWEDSITANVMGIPLCPFFFSGSWAIRACTTESPAAMLNHSCFQTTPHYQGGIVDLLPSTAASDPMGTGVQIEAQNGPSGEFGFFLVSSVGTSVTPLFNGVLCLGTPLGRYNANIATNQSLPQLNSIGQFDGAGILQNIAGTSNTGTGFTIPLELPFSPPGQTIQPGETWFVQLWYRDQMGGSPSANFSNVCAFTMP